MIRASRLIQVTWIMVALIVLLLIYGISNHRNLKYDFANFYDAGQKAKHSEFSALYDPDALIADKPPFGNMTFFSAPITSYLYVPLAALEPKPAATLFKLAGAIAQSIALALLYLATRPLAGSDSGERRVFTALFCATVLFFQPLYTWMFVGGQTTPFVFLLLVLAWRELLRERMVVAAFCMAAVVVIKPAFAPAAVVLFCTMTNRFRVAALVAGGLFILLSLALLGWDVHKAFLENLLHEGSLGNGGWRNSNPFSWIFTLFSYAANHDFAGLIAARVCQLSAASALVWLLFSQLHAGLAGPAARHTAFATAVVTTLTLSPTVWSHYLSALLIPLAALIALRRYLPSSAQVLIIALVFLSIFQNFLIKSKLERDFGFNEYPTVLFASLIVSLPALLMIACMIAFRRHIQRALDDDAWQPRTQIHVAK